MVGTSLVSVWYMAMYNIEKSLSLSLNNLRCVGPHKTECLNGWHFTCFCMVHGHV